MVVDMCVNFQPVTRKQLKTHFNANVQAGATWRAETWPDYEAPIIIGNSASGRYVLLASFGMVPKKFIPPGIKPFSTMNARAETIAKLRSYAPAWHRYQFCLVPMVAFFEPNYESGKAERWKISMADESPFAIAGLYRVWREADGSVSYSFTQITINADDHPLMKRFHKPGAEKRSLVILPTNAYDDWLTCRDAELARTYLVSFPAKLMHATSAPRESAR
jgi:putative SOS response-associated peptidase YedK